MTPPGQPVLVSDHSLGEGLSHIQPESKLPTDMQDNSCPMAVFFLLDASGVPDPLWHCAVLHFLSMGAAGSNDHYTEQDTEVSLLQGTASMVTSGPSVAFLVGR